MTTQEIPLLTVVETAEVLAVHPRTVWRYIERGRLTPVRHPMNRRVYLRERDVLDARERARRHGREERPEGNAQ